jgi:hypothetical protein
MDGSFPGKGSKTPDSEIHRLTLRVTLSGGGGDRVKAVVMFIISSE